MRLKSVAGQAIFTKRNNALREVNHLVCNVGLSAGYVMRADGTDAWVISMYDGDLVYEGVFDVYAHKRSMMRALWREYHKREQLL